MSRIVKDFWSGILIAEAGEDSLRLSITSKSTGNASASIDIAKVDTKELASELLGLVYGTRNILPSQHQPGDAVYFTLPEVPKMYAWVVSVRFYQDKVKYDLELTLPDMSSTRVYNIDSVFVEKFGETETT